MNRIRYFWLALKRWFRGQPPPLRTQNVEELPERLDARFVYIVGEGNHQWFATMLCPCGCGGTIYINLMPDSRPLWELTENDDRKVSIHPSIWRTKGCRSHFFLRNGVVVWCSSNRR
jgi:hypothetical protein